MNFVRPGLRALVGERSFSRMTDRDVEIARSKEQFISTLRRVADALESNTPVRIQVGGKRFTLPADVDFSVEHEAEGAREELELQLRWERED